MIGGQGDGTFQKLPLDKQGAVLPGSHRPLDQRNAAPFDFDTGDAPGMDAAPVVEIGTFAGLGKNRPVGVSGYHNLVFTGREGAQLFFNFFRFLAGTAAPYRRQKTDELQRPPKIPDKKAGQGPQGVVEQAALMAVDQQQALAGLPVFQHQTLSQRSQSQ